MSSNPDGDMNRPRPKMAYFSRVSVFCAEKTLGLEMSVSVLFAEYSLVNQLLHTFRF